MSNNKKTNQERLLREGLREAAQSISVPNSRFLPSFPRLGVPSAGFFESCEGHKQR